jgi:hypothetical protein
VPIYHLWVISPIAWAHCRTRVRDRDLLVTVKAVDKGEKFQWSFLKEMDNSSMHVYAIKNECYYLTNFIRDSLWLETKNELVLNGRTVMYHSS